MSEQVPAPGSIGWFVDGTIEEQKLEDYLLSSTHPEGKNKLRLWRSVFGIGERDAKLLGCLLREHLTQAKPEKRSPVRTKENPSKTIQRWELVIPHFRGPNGNEGPVMTGWAHDPVRDRPHLTTARPLT